MDRFECKPALRLRSVLISNRYFKIRISYQEPSQTKTRFALMQSGFFVGDQ
jgi:hypothetical protein